MHLFAIAGKGACVRTIPLSPRAKASIEPMFERLLGSLRSRRHRHTHYEPGYHAEHDEILFASFVLPPSLRELVDRIPNATCSLTLAEIEEGFPQALLVTLAGADPKWCFQAIDARNFLRQKGGKLPLLFERGTFNLLDITGIVIADRLDAVYQASTLYFRSELVVRRFLDLDFAFKALSDDRLEAFFSRAEFAVSDMELIKENATDLYRRKLARVAHRLGSGAIDIAAVQRAARELSPKVPDLSVSVERGRIVVPQGKQQFAELVRLLNDDYVESSVDRSRHYFSSSKRTL